MPCRTRAKATPQTFAPALLAAAILTAAAPAAVAQSRSRTFELTYRAAVRDVPPGAKAVDVWLPLPQTGRSQTVHRLTLDGPGPLTVGREERFGSGSLHARVAPRDGPVTLAFTALVTRREDAGADEPLGAAERADALKAEPLVPLDGPVGALALEATRGRTSDGGKARGLYDTVVSSLRYDKSGTGWGRGDALFACDARRGNCTDFHALLIGMARSADIPARFAIGLSLPRDRTSGEITGYHCWAELYVRGRGWVPVDASEAAKDPSRRDYYFGHHDADRVELSRGRHLTLEPAQAGPPLNFFVDPCVEVDGRPHAAVDRKVTFADHITGVSKPRAQPPGGDRPAR